MLDRNARYLAVLPQGTLIKVFSSHSGSKSAEGVYLNKMHKPGIPVSAMSILLRDASVVIDENRIKSYNGNPPEGVPYVHIQGKFEQANLPESPIEGERLVFDRTSPNQPFKRASDGMPVSGHVGDVYFLRSGGKSLLIASRLS